MPLWCISPPPIMLHDTAGLTEAGMPDSQQQLPQLLGQEVKPLRKTTEAGLATSDAWIDD